MCENHYLLPLKPLSLPGHKNPCVGLDAPQQVHVYGKPARDPAVLTTAMAMWNALEL